MALPVLGYIDNECPLKLETIKKLKAELAESEKMIKELRSDRDFYKILYERALISEIV